MNGMSEAHITCQGCGLTKMLSEEPIRLNASEASWGTDGKGKDILCPDCRTEKRQDQ